MTLRPPQSLARVINPDTSLSMVQAEMLAESAASLGHHGKKVERLLAQLDDAPDTERAELIYQSARAVWEYFIQRELMGMRDHSLIIREMGIPRAVLSQLGSIR